MQDQKIREKAFFRNRIETVNYVCVAISPKRKTQLSANTYICIIKVSLIEQMHMCVRCVQRAFDIALGRSSF